jgi:hypothetical protein
LQTAKLCRIFELGCLLIETLDASKLAGLHPHALPAFVYKYSILAAFAVFKLLRSHMKALLDEDRGRRAYFATIQLYRQLSLPGGDVSGRGADILTQLWISKKVFIQSDGIIDSLTLRCGSRLAMSVVYDCYWWWRWEFANQSYQYGEQNLVDEGTLSHYGDYKGIHC